MQPLLLITTKCISLGEQNAQNSGVWGRAPFNSLPNDFFGQYLFVFDSIILYQSNIQDCNYHCKLQPESNSLETDAVCKYYTFQRTLKALVLLALDSHNHLCILPDTLLSARAAQ